MAIKEQFLTGVSDSRDPLSTLLKLSDEEKVERGLLHTPREIHQQPATWRQTYQECYRQRSDLVAFLKECGIGSQVPPSPVVFLIGAGTSDYVGRAIASLLREHWSSQVWAVPSTDLLTSMENLARTGRQCLWISFSRSGESSEGLAVLRKARSAHPEVRHLVVTCNAGGSMAQLCAENPERMRALVLDEAVNDKGLAMTSSFSNMVVAGQCLARLKDLETYGQILEGMVEVGKKFLRSAAGVAAKLAATQFSKACFLGTGPLAAVANESALKVLELTAGRIQTMSESTLGFRHGPMSALNQTTLLAQFVSNDPQRKNYDADLLREICAKKLAGTTVAVVPAGAADLEGLVDHTISLDLPPGLEDEYRPPLDAMFGQMFGLFSSLHVGLRPDHPSPNGAIHRVVADVRIYP